MAARLGQARLQQRLALEREQDAHRFRRPGDFLHHEHLPFAGRLLHLVLSLGGLRARGRRNALDIRVRRNEPELARLPPPFAGTRLLHLSDLHLDAGEHHLLALMRLVDGLACDACVLTGDYRFAVDGSCGPAIDALARLAAVLPRPVFAVLGNHDAIALAAAMEGFGFRVLMNEHAVLTRGDAQLYLAGIDDAHYFRTDDIGRAVQGLPARACVILLSHTPEPYRVAAAHDVDLMLCGHTHGGQICLPGGTPVITDCPAPRRFARGAWRFGAMAGYTSVGCGCSIIDARFNCPPEVTLHVLRARPGQ